MNDLKDLPGTDYMYYSNIDDRLRELDTRVRTMREEVGKLSPQVLSHVEQHFRIKGIYHSNAIEGNSLSMGETRKVVEQGITLSGISLRDQAEAKNLSHALDSMERLASNREIPITLKDIRELHYLILTGIDDENAGQYRNDEVEISGSDFKPPKVYEVSQKMVELGDYVQSVTSVENDIHDLPYPNSHRDTCVACANTSIRGRKRPHFQNSYESDSGQTWLSYMYCDARGTSKILRRLGGISSWQLDTID